MLVSQQLSDCTLSALGSISATSPSCQPRLARADCAAADAGAKPVRAQVVSSDFGTKVVRGCSGTVDI